MVCDALAAARAIEKLADCGPLSHEIATARSSGAQEHHISLFFEVPMCGRRPSAELAWRRLRSSAVMCLACLVQPFSRLLALMWFARRVLIRPSGSTPVTQQKVLPPRRPTDRHHAISTSHQHLRNRDALRRVPLALALRRTSRRLPRCQALIRLPRTPPLDIGGRIGRPRRRRRGP